MRRRTAPRRISPLGGQRPARAVKRGGNDSGVVAHVLRLERRHFQSLARVVGRHRAVVSQLFPAPLVVPRTITQNGGHRVSSCEMFSATANAACAAGDKHAQAPVVRQAHRARVAQLDALRAQGGHIDRVWRTGAEVVGLAGQALPARALQQGQLFGLPARELCPALRQPLLNFGQHPGRNHGHGMCAQWPRRRQLLQPPRQRQALQRCNGVGTPHPRQAQRLVG